MKVLVIGIVALVAAVGAVRDPCFCNRMYLPVCGSDGITYGNECMFNCEKATKNHDLELEHNGPCETEEVAVARKPCICPYIWAPVCGTDGHTYASECNFNCAKSRGIASGVEIAHRGSCDESQQLDEEELKVRDPCICTKIYMPVCGTNGETYPNICELRCAASSDSGLKFRKNGECEEINEVADKEVESCMASCPDYVWEICDNFGTTYKSSCQFNCARGKNPEIQFGHYGKCEEENAIEEESMKFPRRPCICNRMWMPVCGTDGHTYGNECMLNCAKAEKNHELEVAHQGVCENTIQEEELFRDPCICNKMYLPVCGSDGKTYSNPCVLNCAKHSGNPELEMVSHGPCERNEVEEEEEDLFRDPCACNKMFRPVCGSDGHTYSNPCRLNCIKQTQNPALDMVHLGPCESRAIEEAEDYCHCPLMTILVCGNDGKTYANPCELQCAKRRTNKNLELVHAGPCQVQAEEEEEFPRDPCVCNKMLLPVCGSDGHTYSNPCMLNCAKSTENPDLKQMHFGPCIGKGILEEEEHPVDHCACARIYFPVCGSDGQTYANPCLLNCAKHSGNPSLNVVNYGPCTSVSFEETKRCYCADYYRPVCGKDGDTLKTFTNNCFFSCYARDNPNLQFVKHTACEDNTNALAQVPCICTMEWNPICGTDGHTYGNLCGLKCAARQNPQLTVAKHGRCEENNEMLRAEPCICTLEWNPVCGSDGHTYGNLCGFKCAAKHNPGLTVVKHGQCEENSEISLKENVFCEKNWEPVCGSDGHTYTNYCMLRMAVRKNKGLKMIYPGPCVIL